MTPSNQVKTIIMAGCNAGARLFRRNVGLAWTGSRITKHPDGSITIHDPRPFKTGIAGQSDIDGWKSITITPEMVGTKIAQHVEIEVKQGSGRLTTEQAAYLEAARAAGCLAGLARSPQDALAILRGDLLSAARRRT